MRAEPQPVFFDSFVDALISRAHGAVLTPRIKDKLRALEDRGPTGVTLRYADVCNVPHFFFGLMVEGAQLSREKNPRVTLLKVEPPGATFLCEWD